jgi:putative ABC transport system permease protein
MTACWRKSIRDVWRERTRTAFVIAAIALGVAAFFGLLSSYAILTRELNRGYLSTNPASAILHTDAVDENMLATVLANPEVGTADARRIVSGRFKAGPAQWRNLALFVIRDYGDIRLNNMVPEKGAWPPATGEMLIERDAFQVAHAKIGETAMLRTEDGREHTLRVSGRVHDVGQPQARMENSVYGYITLPTLADLGEKPFFDLLCIQVAREKYDEAHIRQVAKQVQQRLEADGHPVRQIDIPVPGKHPHADLMGTLLLAMSSFGLFVLALSGVLALSFIAALMAAELRQIGIMKAIGGTRKQLARIYLVQSLLLGAVATIVAIPFGIWGSHLFCRYMVLFLNFDIASFAIPAWVFILALIVGLAVPLAACVIPVWHGVAIPVRKALASAGSPADNFGSSGFDRTLAGMGGGLRPLLFAIRNSFRRRTRLVLTCMTLACGGVLFMTALNLRTSMIRTFDRLFAAQKYDLTLFYGGMYPTEKIDRAVRSVPSVIASENWIATDGWIPGALTTGNSENLSSAKPDVTRETGAYRFTVFAMPPDSKMFVPVLAQGRSLLPGENDTIMLNQTMAAQNPGIKLGDAVSLHIGTSEREWRVVGIDREPMAPPPIVYVPISVLQVHPGMATLTRIAIRNPGDALLEAVRDKLDRNLQQEGVRVMGASGTADFRFAVGQHMLMIYVFLVLASSVVAAVGGLGLMTTMGITVLERRREIGILRAIGATPKLVTAMVIAEANTVAVIAWITAVLLSWPFSGALAGMIGRSLHGAFDFRVAPYGVILCFAASLLLAALASFLPAESALRLTVREALAYE